MSDLVNVALQTVENLINEVFQNKKSLECFMNVIATFPEFDYMNQLLILKQCPHASFVIGKNAYEAVGKEIPSDAQKILLITPIIKCVQKGNPLINEDEYVFTEDERTLVYDANKHPEYEFIYEAVVGYDVSSLEGEKIRNKNFILNNIRQLTHFSITEQESQDEKYFGEINFETQQLIIKKDISEDRMLAELIRQYISYKREEMEFTNYEKCFQKFAEIVVSNAFGVGYQQQRPMAILQFFKTQELETKKEFLQKISLFTGNIISELSEKQFFSFNEIALLNNLLHTSNFNDLQIDFYTVREYIENEYIRQQLVELSDKLFRTEEYYLNELCEKVKDGQLFNYPPYEIDYFQ